MNRSRGEYIDNKIEEITSTIREQIGELASAAVEHLARRTRYRFSEHDFETTYAEIVEKVINRLYHGDA